MAYIYYTTDKSKSLYHDALFLLGVDRSDTTTYPLEDFIRNANSWYRKANTWIWQSTGEWEYDDSNYTNLPIATTTLVAGQNDYELPSDAQKVDRIEVLNASGDYEHIKTIDKSQISGALSEYYETDGMPKYYDLVGRSIILYPAPSATETTLAAGLKIYFTRDIEEFETDDTNKEPGFVSDFHRLISLGAALDFALVTGSNKINFIREQIQLMEADLKQFYGSRQREAKVMIKKNRRLHS